MAITPIQDLVTAALARPSGSAASSSAANVVSTQSSTAASASSSISSYTPSASLVATAGLQNASVNLSQLGSLLEVAQTGSQHITSALQQLQGLAQQAQGGTGSASVTLAGIDSEFQDLLTQIDSYASGSTFGGTSLLDGSFSGADTTAASPTTSVSTAPAVATQTVLPLSLPDLTTQSLFGGNTLSIATPQAAAAAAGFITSAQQAVSETTDSIGSVQNQVGFAIANVQSALANTVAASSVLTESDVAGGSDGSDGLLGNSAFAASIQTANLPASLLSLVQE